MSGNLTSLSYSVFPDPVAGLTLPQDPSIKCFCPLAYNHTEPKILLKNQLCAPISEAGFDDW
jgi:hypothetical protein